jgi:hypothetical protein
MNAEKKAEKKQRKLAQSYRVICEKYNIDTNTNFKDQVRAMVIAGEEIQQQICDLADTIKINDYERVKGVVDISKGAWNAVVNVNAKKDTIKTETLDKYLERTQDQIRSEMYKQLHISNILGSKSSLIIPDGDVECKVDEMSNPLYDEILDESTQTRIKINTELYAEYNVLAEAAEYISGGDVNHARFKQMVDLEHYKGGWPSENTPPRIDSVICKFLEAYYLCKKYNVADFDDHLKYCIEDLYDGILSVEHIKNGKIEPNPLKRSIDGAV